MKAKKKIWLVLGFVLFTAYYFIAARSIPLETVLVPRWLNSLESGNPGNPVPLSNSFNAKEAPGSPLAFNLGDRFGYVGGDGHFFLNQIKKAHVSISPELWAEYEAEPERIAIQNSSGETLVNINNPRGYPFFLDGRIFIIGSEQNAISEIDAAGMLMWTYEFASPITCVDSAAGLLLVGSLDGLAIVLGREGRQIFSFEPGGSRYSIILGCAISRDGSRLALISGIDDQRFLLLEQFGTNTGDYKVVYHEFLNDSFRRPVYVSFVEADRWVIFERTSGLGLYEISTRNAVKVELNGAISAIDNSGGQGMVFVVISRPGNLKELIGVRLPGRVIIESPFRSEEVFLGRMDSRLIVGGGQTLVSFDLEKR